MLPRLRRRLDRMERQRAALLAELDGMPPERLAFRPAPDSWGALEVVEHLVRVEEAVVLRAAQAPASRTFRQRLRAAGSFALFRLILGSGVRVKVPVKAVMPDGKATLPELRERWDRIRGKLEAVLADCRPGDLRRPMMRHPATGWLSTVETLGFLEWHVRHHRRQLERIKRAGGWKDGRTEGGSGGGLGGRKDGK